MDIYFRLMLWHCFVCQPGAVIRWWTSTAAVRSACPTWRTQFSTSQHTLLHSASRSRYTHTHTQPQLHLDGDTDHILDPEKPPWCHESVLTQPTERKQQITWVWQWGVTQLLVFWCVCVCVSCGFSLNVVSCRPPNTSAKTSRPKCVASACTSSAR